MNFGASRAWGDEKGLLSGSRTVELFSWPRRMGGQCHTAAVTVRADSDARAAARVVEGCGCGYEG